MATNHINEFAGKLDQRVKVQRYTKTEDGMGGGEKSWITQFTVWAMVKAMSGRERNMGTQTESSAKYRVIIRRSSDSKTITEKDRIEWNGKTMNIRFIADEGDRKQFLMIECEQGVAT